MRRDAWGGGGGGAPAVEASKRLLPASPCPAVGVLLAYLTSIVSWFIPMPQREAFLEVMLKVCPTANAAVAAPVSGVDSLELYKRGLVCQQTTLLGRFEGARASEQNCTCLVTKLATACAPCPCLDQRFASLGAADGRTGLRQVSARTVLLATGFWSIKRVKVDGGEGSFVASNTQARAQPLPAGAPPPVSASVAHRAVSGFRTCWAPCCPPVSKTSEAHVLATHSHDVSLPATRLYTVSCAMSSAQLPAVFRGHTGTSSGFMPLLLAGTEQGKRKLARSQRRGRETRQPVAVGAILSNHIGWADILIHMCAWLPAFVARDDTARLPFIGITRHASVLHLSARPP